MTVGMHKGEGLEGVEGEDKKYKDDWSINEKSEPAEFLANAYWRKPEQYSIDDLLKEQLEEEGL